ncbi:MAG TPA: ATPase, partial [Clostridiales bacterium]|nr:ATPase [Clostridiales bacterium]
STTENPYFTIYGALLSRSTVFEFNPVEPMEIMPVLRRAFDILNGDMGGAKHC